jgi:tripartite-type tricarboxylate transporter receptor subunit TctC
MVRFCCVPSWIAAACIVFVFGAATAEAQIAYPNRPVKIIVPIGPGGSYDLVGRYVADALSKRTGQAFFVENKPGAGTVVGTQAAAQSEADGYTRCTRSSATIRARILSPSRWSTSSAM